MWSCHAAIPFVPRSILDPAATNDVDAWKKDAPGAHGGEGARGEEGGICIVVVGNQAPLSLLERVERIRFQNCRYRRSGRSLFEYPLQGIFDERNIFPDGFPYHRCIYSKIGMYQFISHPGNLLPWQLRVPFPDTFRDMF